MRPPERLRRQVLRPRVQEPQHGVQLLRRFLHRPRALLLPAAIAAWHNDTGPYACSAIVLRRWYVHERTTAGCLNNARTLVCVWGLSYHKERDSINTSTKMTTHGEFDRHSDLDSRCGFSKQCGSGTIWTLTSPRGCSNQCGSGPICALQTRRRATTTPRTARPQPYVDGVNTRN